MGKVAIETLGCKLNQADSLKMGDEFSGAGFSLVDTESECDIYIINTCTVTHVADRKGRQSIRRAKRNNPDSLVVVTGCYAEKDRNSLEKLAEVDLVVGNTQKSEIVNLALDELATRSFSTLERSVGEHLSEGIQNANRAMLKIQEGCDQMCSYCIVSKVRGRERSVPVNDLIDQANDLYSRGYKEIVLTGTQLGSYGFEFDNTSLKTLLNGLITDTDIGRIRVSSVQPQEFSDELLDLWDSGRLCPHFHIPLQSGSDRILGLMRRRYDSKLFLESIEKVRSRVDKASITTDVIVGFPGETEEDFIATKSVCDRAKFSDMHVFKFSKRNGTIAAHLEDDVSYQVKTRRSRELITMGEKYFSDFRMKMDGSSENVLWETKSVSAGRPKFIYGLTENYVRVKGKYESLESDLEELVVKYDSSNPVGLMIACH